ncbi:hypothetical protein DSC45_33500 [Streptomyces sp. YIM 130001]|uniref:hypothetical protein n=1 Tax=Streptomyces sp. YIM 130001 TaxID=2259644 RepID=UPI000E65BF74|nr:hypothetical protein [Streptomyces sp. YIM 130001]RII08098.1 hypothetical protein DSC45_33500 [Streptomyces sp. YIM 130001]
MSGRASAVQRRIMADAEPVTGRLSGTPAQLEGLVARGLAFRHARPPRAYFLTPAGHRFREELRSAAAPPAPAHEAGSGVFAARAGEPGEAPSGPARAREVHSAWQGLIELRRMTHRDGSTERPCAWERSHLVQAAALALEAAGCTPASSTASGYRVGATPQPEAVAVRFVPGGTDGRSTGDDGTLDACARALDAAGWQVGSHTERGGGRCVLASPRRV